MKENATRLMMIGFTVLGTVLVAGELLLGNPDELVSLPEGKEYVWLSEQQAAFERVPGGVAWISDIEHVIEKYKAELYIFGRHGFFFDNYPQDKPVGDIYLADGKPPYYLYGETIPAGKFFELFPYHYYGANEEKILGRRINYKLVIKNVAGRPVKLVIRGMGTTTDWDHYKTWEAALRGDNQTTITLKPAEIYTLWEEKQLKGDLPWSAIVLGKADGDIWVGDYCYLGKKDPGIKGAKQMPDLALPPYLLASFTRGLADWNAAIIKPLVHLQGGDERIKLSKVPEKIYGLAFGYSPGGPFGKPCEYKAMEPTFKEDRVWVEDPVSGEGHLFFGGNYPIMYKVTLPLKNDTEEAKHISFYLSSNDEMNVDSIAGVWVKEKMVAQRVPGFPKDKHWRAFTQVLNPGDEVDLEFVVVSLGGRWGGLVASLEVATGKIVDQMALYYLKKVDEFQEQNKKEKPGGIVLLGDSLTEGFPLHKMLAGKQVINRGISGDKIGGWDYYGVLDRLDVSVYELKPAKLFLLIGINDIVFWDTPTEEMVRGYDQLLRRLKQQCPDTEIYVQSLLPLRDNYAKHNAEANQFNQKLQQLVKKYALTYVDLHPQFRNEAGELKAELTYDGLHLTETGYEVWAEIIKASPP